MHKTTQHKTSAGLLMYRHANGALELLLVKPGGPFWKNKDAGAWTIPKGEPTGDEALLDTAQREFAEETGTVPTGPYVPLTPVKQKAGKAVHAWAMRGSLDPATIRSNTFTMQWPPKSGKFVAFPEIERGEFFDVTTARQKINPAQAVWLDELMKILAESSL